MNNQFSDDFINYSFFPNDVFDPDFNLSSPFSEQSDSTNLPTYMPKTIKNILDPQEELPRKESTLSDCGSFVNNVSQPSQNAKRSMTIRSEVEEMSEMLEDMDDTEFTSPEPEPERKILPRSKKIQKKEKPVEKPKTPKGKPAKQKRMSATEALLSKVDKRFIPEGFDDPDLDDKTRKKMIQMIRNRVSAQTSRDRKKAYMMQVEQDKEELSEENEKLTRENANLLAKVKKLQEENDMLKQNMLCAKCGCTYEGQSPNQDTTVGGSPNRSDIRSESSGPTRTVRGRKGVFGFSMAFAAILCFFLFLNGGSIGDFSSRGSKMNKMKRPMQFVSKLFNTSFENAPTCSKEFGNKYMSESMDPSVIEELVEGMQKEFEQDQTEVINKIKPIMEEFEAHHKELYQVFESKNDIIDLSNVKQGLEDSTNTNKDSSFMGKNSVAKNNKTSTLFCPTGFELSSQVKNADKIEEEFDPIRMDETNQLSKKTLDVQNAEYIQLLIPKHAMEQTGTVDNEKNSLAFKKFDEESSFIEVWCKIFAIRDLANLASY